MGDEADAIVDWLSFGRVDRMIERGSFQPEHKKRAMVRIRGRDRLGKPLKKDNPETLRRVRAMGITNEIEEITPDLAREYLRHNEPILDGNGDVIRQNRRTDSRNIQAYSRLMATGKWRLIGDPIRFAESGRLIDGQNRLMAVVKSGTTQNFYVMRGLTDEDQAYIDNGKKRTGANALGMVGVKNSARCASATSVLMAWDAKQNLDRSITVAPTEILDYYRDNLDIVNASVGYSVVTKRDVPVAEPILSATYVLASRSADAFMVNAFFEPFRTGIGFGDKSPINGARKWFIRSKNEGIRRNRMEQMWILNRAWNRFANGTPGEKMQLPVGGVTDFNQFLPWIPVKDEVMAALVPLSERNPAQPEYRLVPE